MQEFASFKDTKLKNNFLKGVKWSPDGTCLLTNSEDHKIRLFEMPEEANDSHGSYMELAPTFSVTKGEAVHDIAWFPQMRSDDAATCCFLSTGRGAPMQLWDAFTGELRATYRAFDQVDEVTSAYSAAFNEDGSKIFGGFKNLVRVFDIQRPGRECQELPTFNRKTHEGYKGIVSCFAFNPDRSGLMATGSFEQKIGLCLEQTGETLYVLEGQKGGITQVMFTPCGRYLISGARKSGEILIWDIRGTGDVLHRLQREVTTNQRITFDLDFTGRYLVSACQTGSLLVFDLHAPSAECIARHPTGCASLNSAAIHPWLPYVATASGQRSFTLPAEYTDVNDEDHLQQLRQAEQRSTWGNSCLVVWRMGKV